MRAAIDALDFTPPLHETHLRKRHRVRGSTITSVEHLGLVGREYLHDRDGRTDLKEDDHGLFGKGQILLDAGDMEKRAYAHMKARTVTGLSIGYWIRESSYDEKTGIRTLTKLDLVEISLVTFPANDDARVEAVKFKLAHGELPTDREFEKFLREAGFSKTRAAGLVGHGLGELRRRESERDTTTSTALKGISDTLSGFKL